MPARARIALGVAAAALLFAGVMALSSPTAPPHSDAEQLVAALLTPAPPITVPPTTVTTFAPIVVTRPPVPATTAVTSPATTRPAAVAAPTPVVRTTSSCGWSWDAFHRDDGFHDEVTIAVEAPRHPNEVATITAVPHGSNIPMVKITTTDAGGNASALFRITNDKRDWTITISATFPTGAPCTAQTFSITYG